MTLETFFDKFDLFADAPGGVAKMRELVLELAVQGKLVQQDPNDEPAAILLAQIADEKRRLIAMKIIRDKNEPLPIAENDLPFEVPYGWEWTRLSRITRRIHYGYTASAKSELKDVRLLRITDIQNNSVNWPSLPGCEIAMDDVGQYQIERGDILVARTGGTVGKTYLVQDVPMVSVFASYLIRIQGGSSFCNRYLKLFLESPAYWVQLEEGARGAAQPNVNGQTLGNMVVPIPPLAEQKRIVAKVDELMAVCDRLEAQYQEREEKRAALARASLARFTEAPTPANLPFLFHESFDISPADLRKTILTLAVQGKLVPQDPNDEPAELLVRRVAMALPNKRSENPFLEDIEVSDKDEPEYDLPLGWTWLPLGHLGNWATGCGFPTQYQGETDKEFLFCKVSDMNLPGNEVEIQTTVNSIGVEVMRTIRARANPPGTVIFPKIGGAIATHKRRLVVRPTIIDNNCSGIQPIGLTDDRWLLLLMKNLDLTKYQSGTSVPAVSQSALDPIRIGLPPLAEQKRIVAKVDELMALVDEWEAQLAAARATGEKLLAALVAELTNGKEAHAAR